MRTTFEAAKINDYEYLHFLLSHGNDANERNDIGLNCLHIAATFGSLECAKVLTAYGVDLESKDWESGWTALHRAIYFNQTAVAIFLVGMGAALFSNDQIHAIKDHSGLEPLDLLSIQLKCYLPCCNSRVEAGCVMTFGKSDFMLGIPLPKASQVTKPKIVEKLLSESVVDIYATKYHSFAINSAGQVFSWGHGKGGRLGHGDDRSRFEPSLIVGLHHMKVVKLSASESHVMALTQDGELFSWGSNSVGQLGHGLGESSSTLYNPRRVDSLRNVSVVGMVAGQSHSLCYSIDNDLFGWGSNEMGELGLPICARIAQPKKIKHIQHHNIVQLLVHDFSSLMLCRSAPVTSLYSTDAYAALSEVWSWGNGNHHFRRVAFPKNRRPTDCLIKQLAAGNNRFYALSENGLVYSWGYTVKFDDFDRSLPIINEALQPQNAFSSFKSIVGCNNRVCAITDIGELYYWTSDHHGKNGCNEYLPRKVHGVKRAIKATMGCDHTMVLISPSVPIGMFHPLHYSNIVSLKTMCEVVLIKAVNLKNIFDCLDFAVMHSASCLTRYCWQYLRQNLDIVLVLFNSLNLKRYTDHDRFCLFTDDGSQGLTENSLHKPQGPSMKLSLPPPTELEKHMKSIRKKLQSIAHIENKIQLGIAISNEQLVKVNGKKEIQLQYSRLEQQMVRMQKRSGAITSHVIKDEELSSTILTEGIKSEDVDILAMKDNIISDQQSPPLQKLSMLQGPIAEFVDGKGCPWIMPSKFQLESHSATAASVTIPFPKPSCKTLSEKTAIHNVELSPLTFNLTDYISTNKFISKQKKSQKCQEKPIESTISPPTRWSSSSYHNPRKQPFLEILHQEEQDRLASDIPALKGNDIPWYIQRKPRNQRMEDLIAEQEREREEQAELELALKQIAAMEERESQKRVSQTSQVRKGHKPNKRPGHSTRNISKPLK